MKRFVLILPAVLAIIGPSAEDVRADERRYAAVYLDPHYGGRDNGPVLDRKYKGKDITLSIAKAIQQELARNNIKAYLSREDDIYIPRGDRWFFAKKKGADIYLSIRLILQERDCVRLYHAGRRLPESVKIDNGEKVLSHASSDDMARESVRLAETLLKNMMNNEPAPCGTINTKKDVLFETADFPAAIIEFGIGRHDRHHSYILDSAQRGVIAKSMATAVEKFIEAQPH